jgi:hypothetical protein
MNYSRRIGSWIAICRGLIRKYARKLGWLSCSGVSCSCWQIGGEVCTTDFKVDSVVGTVCWSSPRHRLPLRILFEGSRWLSVTFLASSPRRLSMLSSRFAGGVRCLCCNPDASAWTRQKRIMAQQTNFMAGDGMASDLWVILEFLLGLCVDV